MPFPLNPINGQTAVINNILYKYDVINNRWNKSRSATGETTTSSLLTTELNVVGTTALNAISANGTLGVSGQVLTSNGSDTFWAPVSDPSVVPLRNELNELVNLDINGIFNSVLE